MVENWMDYAGVAATFAKKNARPTMTAEELYPVGLAGLWKAAKSFDPARNDDFRGFASVRVRGEIIDFLRQHFGKGQKKWMRARRLGDREDVAVRDRGLKAVDDRDELEHALRKREAKAAMCRRGHRIIEHRGRKMSLTAWAALLGIKVPTLSRRIERHGVEWALTEPVRRMGAA